MPSAQVEHTRQEIEDVIGIEASHAPCVSAKTGLNIKDVLEAIVKYVPAPTGDVNKPLKALIFDSVYDSYRGVVIYLRVKEGSIKVGDMITLMATNKTYEVLEVGVRTPKEVSVDSLDAGEVGYISAAIKTIKDVRVGDTAVHG